MNYHQALKILSLKDPPKPQEVKKAYHRLALKYHPDRNPENASTPSGDPPPGTSCSAAAESFRECTEAYNYLVCNLKKWAGKGDSSPTAASKTATVKDLEDIFDDIFGFSREDRVLGLQKPQDMEITHRELAHGVRKKARLIGYEKCRLCRGSGSASNSHAAICTYCFGSGQIKTTYGNETRWKVCPRCEGRGRKVSHPCSSCNGFGRMEVLRKQEVEIPAGLSAGFAYTLRSTDLSTGQKLHALVRLKVKNEAKLSWWRRLFARSAKPPI
ncbi:MAG: J domain-containing protein [Deltaproteobacteria bacterium]|nr:J domain-containing protein [Deltaproteobacteria bacterium]